MSQPNQENVSYVDNTNLANGEDINNGKGMVDYLVGKLKEAWAIHFCKQMCKASFKLFNVSKKELSKDLFVRSTQEELLKDMKGK